MGDHGKNITIDATDKSVTRVTQPRGTLRDRVQHRLNIRRRAGDHAQNVAGRSELLQRFVALAL
jgi:hypothetical protein